MKKLIISLLLIVCWPAPAQAQNSELIQSYVDSLANLYLITEKSLSARSESDRDKINACSLEIESESIVNKLKMDLEHGYFWFQNVKHEITPEDHITIRLDHLPKWESRLKWHGKWCS